MPGSIDPPSSGAIDWQKAHERLAEIAARLEGGLNGADVAAAMRRRAQLLAAAEDGLEATAKRDVIVFGLAGERYALDVARAAGVVPLSHVVALPGAEAEHLGLLAHRGLLFALIDLNALLDRPVARAGAPVFAVLLDDPDCAVALAADVVHGIGREDAGRLDAGGDRPSIVRSILPDGTSVLAPDAVTRNARLVVDHRLRDALPI